MRETKILIVDNEISVRKFLRDLLEVRGFHSIELARNGQEGVEIYLSSGADIVLMDIEMPVMNGYEASKLIKSADPNANIIIMTGRPNGPLAIRTLAEGYALTLFSKPFVFKDLFETIDRIIYPHAHTLAPCEDLDIAS